jgi:predicted acetyltransferase
MDHPQNEPALQVQVTLATPEQQTILSNLLELYAYDFSEFHPVELGPEGRFGYADLQHYWTLPDRFPFLFTVNGRLAGLALIKKGSEISGDPSIWDVHEFFVLRAFRRRGMGLEAAHKIWRMFPGSWEVRVMNSNASALGFWQRAISVFTASTAEPAHLGIAGKPWSLFAFKSS